MSFWALPLFLADSLDHSEFGSDFRHKHGFWRLHFAAGHLIAFVCWVWDMGFGRQNSRARNAGRIPSPAQFVVSVHSSEIVVQQSMLSHSTSQFPLYMHDPCANLWKCIETAVPAWCPLWILQPRGLIKTWNIWAIENDTFFSFSPFLWNVRMLILFSP